MGNSLLCLTTYHLVLVLHTRIVQCASIDDRQDICNQFPSVVICQQFDDTSTTMTPMTEIKSENVLLPEDQIFSTLDYCTKYNTRYNRYCNGRIRDSVIMDFCRSYKKRCAQDTNDFITSNIPQDTTTVAPATEVTPSPLEITNYCNTYKKSYPKWCNKTKVREDAVPFCIGYVQYCGVPIVSSYPRNYQVDGLTSNNIVVDDKRGKLNRNLLGIPIEPLSGLGDMPQYGGPVRGGFGFGKSLFAPFFGANQGFNIVPTKRFNEGQNYNIAGLKFGSGSMVDWSGLPFLVTENNVWKR